MTSRSMPASSMDRRQRHDHLHRRAVRVGDDPVVALDRVGVDLGDDQGHVLVHAPVAGVVDDDRAGVDQLRRPLGADRAARRGEDDVEALDRAPRSAAGTRACEPSHSILLARPSARRRTAPPRPPGSRARRARCRIVEPTSAGRAQHPDSVAVRSSSRQYDRCLRTRRAAGARCPSGPPADRVGAELEGLVQRLDRVGTSSAEITQEILIGEVEIISMLILCSPSVSNTLAATPGWLRMPAPTIETLPIRSSLRIPAETSPSAAIVCSARRGRRARR